MQTNPYICNNLLLFKLPDQKYLLRLSFVSLPHILPLKRIIMELSASKLKYLYTCTRYNHFLCFHSHRTEVRPLIHDFPNKSYMTTDNDVIKPVIGNVKIGPGKARTVHVFVTFDRSFDN